MDKVQVYQGQLNNATGGLLDGQMDWGGKGGKCWEIWKVEPCCGAPPNPKDALYCLACWCCLQQCTWSKAWAHSLGQNCSVVNHCLIPWIISACGCAFVIQVLFRANLRKANGIGAGGPADGLVGDCVCTWCCPWCAAAQQLRSMKREDWDWWAAKDSITIYQPEIKFMR